MSLTYLLGVFPDARRTRDNTARYSSPTVTVNLKSYIQKIMLNKQIFKSPFKRRISFMAFSGRTTRKINKTNCYVQCW